VKLCLGWAAVLLPAALLAQPQIGGGQCSSSTLNGNYSLSLSGRQMSQASSSGATVLGFKGALQGIGSASFDGQNKITITLANNTNSATGTAQTWSGTYTLQANCTGTVTLTGNETATFTLGAYDSGATYFLDGYDGTYSFTGSGTSLPATCSASLLNGTYAFNGNGFVLNSGAIGTVNAISGILTFDGTNAATGNWYVSIAGGTQNTVTTGAFTVTSNCTASATLSDTSGNKYSLQMVITAPKGTNFILSGASPSIMFSGSGRTL
jgi:hypothetical protein